MKKIASINSTLFFLHNKEPFDTFIWLGKNFIQLAVCYKEHAKIEVLESYKTERGNVTRTDALDIFNTRIVKDASTVYVGLESRKNTLIPDALFQREMADNYLKELFTLEKEEVVSAQKIKPLACQSIYTIKKGTQKLLEDKIKNTVVFHAPSTLLIAYQQMIPPNKKLTSFVRLQDNEILISLFKDKKLQLHQTYDIHNLDDANYYYLNALDQLGLERKKMTLSIFGNHEQIEDFKITMEANLGLVKLINRLPTLQYTDEMFSHPAHHFFNLFSLVLCA